MRKLYVHALSNCKTLQFFLFSGKEDPWQGQQIPHSYRPMGAGGQPPHMQQQQRMLYPPYPAMTSTSPSIVAGMHSGQQQQGPLGGPYHQQSPPGMQQRYMYMQQSPPGPQGQQGGSGGAYYSASHPHAGGQLPPAGMQQQGPGDLAGGVNGGADGSTSPMYGSQHSPHDLMGGPGLGSRVPSQDNGEYGNSNVGVGGGTSPPGGLEVLPPPQIPQQQQQQYPLDSESSHVRPPEGNLQNCTLFTLLKRVFYHS